ncbi:MAG: ABC transporter permease [Parafilimonas sp.]
MFKNYFKTAFRNFSRNKIFAGINVLGLSIGISAALVIFLIVQYEFSYDAYEKDNSRIYRVVLDANFGGVEGHSAAVPAPLSNAIEREVTGVEKTVPVMQFQGDAKVTVTRKGNHHPVIFKKQPGIVFTNAQYFSLLPYQWIAGSAQSALKNPFTVVLTQHKAQQYFPSLSSNEIIGKQINYNNDITATVSGIVQDLNETTSFQADEFISYATISQTHLQNDFMMNVWNDWMSYSQLYVELDKASSVTATEAQLKTLLKKYSKDAEHQYSNTIVFRLQPLNDVHFNHLYASPGLRTANKPTLYSLLAVAAFLLLLGCINFINLTTANAAQRAKEIGIRKTMGSSRKQLIFQFLGETFLLTIIASFLAFCFTPLLLKLFADFIPPGLSFQPLHQPYIFLFLLLLALVVSVLSGLYPAFILSGYKPVQVLKTQSFISSSDTRNTWIRKSLTISQFVIAQFFVIATLMVSKQINYSLNTDLGFNKDGIITFQLPRDTIAAHSKQLLSVIKSIPGVEIASAGFLSPADKGMSFANVSYAAKPDIKAQIQIRWGDTNYLKVYKLKLLAGRNVTASDTMKEFLINDMYAKILGFKKPEDAIGKYLTFFNNKNMPVVGVLQDFHDQSTHAPISPMVFAGSLGDEFHVRLQPAIAGTDNWKNAISKIQKAFHQMYPDEDFNYQFVDEMVAEFYTSEQQIASLLSWATALSILISCLGLLGLVMYTINSRTKEIGIRKILGASVSNIICILSKDFIKLVLIAFIIAAPIAWWTSYKWLEDFAYRTQISWWLFILSGLGMLLLALITLSIQTIKAAIANPIKSLRTE